MALVHMKLMLLMKLLLVLSAADPPPPDLAKPDCLDSSCGNFKPIPYPFGISDDCYLPPKGQDSQETPFKLECDNSSGSPTLKLKMISTAGPTTISVTNFSISAGELEVLNPVASDCGRDISFINMSQGFSWSPPFSISPGRNWFVAVGCDIVAGLAAWPIPGSLNDNGTVRAGCLSMCSDMIHKQQNNNCTGTDGCCQTSVPEGRVNETLTIIGNSITQAQAGSDSKHNCSYAFLVKDGSFSHMGDKSFEDLETVKEMPIILNWQIGHETCEDAKKNIVDYACKNYSTCNNRTDGPYSGYYCSCIEGYEGNPYIGCRDIDECNSAQNDPCGGNGTCHNKPGSYYCECNSGFKHDSDGRKCVATANNILLKISLGVCISFCVLLLVIFGVYRRHKRKQFKHSEEEFFKNNGGRELVELIASKKLAIFSFKMLQNATDKFLEEKVIGEGDYGIVYKGKIKDKGEVAIKMSKELKKNNKIKMSRENDPVKGSPITKEVVVISGLHHRNVARLIGCCLETPTPTLVYEYVHGTLYDHIHKMNDKDRLSFVQRLEIAAETSSALSYLHSTDPQILHRNIKTTNILLDEKLRPKVSDFGILKPIPEGKTQFSTSEQGKVGPQCHQSNTLTEKSDVCSFGVVPEDKTQLSTSEKGTVDSQSNTLTEKSDVYSYGVVLVELLTSKKAVHQDEPEKGNGGKSDSSKNSVERVQINVFVSIVEKDDDTLIEQIDHAIVKDGNTKTIKKMAKLARRCLHEKEEKRPTMKEVEWELHELVKEEKELHASSSEVIADSPAESHSNAHMHQGD